MSSVEGPMLMEKQGDYPVIEYCRKLMYWQGFWLDDPEPDLEFYLQFFSPWLARLLVKHRYLRLALRFVRHLLPRFMIISISAQVFFMFPMGMYLYKDEALDAMANLFAIVIMGLQLAGATCVYLQPDTLRNMFDEMKTMLVAEQLDNQVQRKLFFDTRSFCWKIIRYFTPTLSVLLSLLSVLDTTFNLLPERRFSFREWHPWSTNTSPSFEITLFVRMIQIVYSSVVSITEISSLAIQMMLARANLMILNDKLKNVRQIAINRIKARNLKESVHSPEYTIVTIDIEHSQQVETPGRALQGHQVRAGCAAFNARRVDNLALLIPLHEVDSTLPGAVRDETPLRVALQGEQLRAGQGALNARRVDQALLGDAECSVPGALRDETPLEGLLQLKDGDIQVVDNSESTGLNRISPEELDNEMQIVLAEGIELHTKLIRYNDACASFTNLIMIVMLGANTLLFAVTALIHANSEGDDLLYRAISATFTSMMTVVYLIVNNMMQLISDQGEAVCTSVYSCDWTGASPSFKKSMLVIMSRANVPLEMKPTGLDPLSRKNFGQVMNSAYNMINTLNTMVK